MTKHTDIFIDNKTTDYKTRIIKMSGTKNGALGVQWQGYWD